jgi:hypothetical protein
MKTQVILTMKELLQSITLDGAHRQEVLYLSGLEHQIPERRKVVNTRLQKMGCESQARVSNLWTSDLIALNDCKRSRSP